MAIQTISLLATIAIGTAFGIPTDGGSNLRNETISWGACPSAYPSTIDCANLTVPMDYERPAGPKITLGMVRLKASGYEPLGNLLFNPGGPGGSAVVQLVAQAEAEAANYPVLLFSRKLRSHYNIIAPDPRGIGLSTPVKCDHQLYNRRVTSHISDEEDYDAVVAWGKAVGQSCIEKTGPVLKYLDTISAAKDFDQIRQALGDEKINYLGYSYGTQLASQYAALFPEHVGRMVLDGNVDHSQSDVSSLIAEAATFENTLDQFFDWCNQTSHCPFHDQDFPRMFDEMIDEANENPIPAPGCLSPSEAVKSGTSSCRSDVTGWELLSNVQPSLVFPKSKTNSVTWLTLSHTLYEAYHGNATSLSSRLATSDTSTITESLFPWFAIGCVDWIHGAATARTQYDLRAKLLMTGALAPHTRGISQTLDYQARCVGWPEPVSNPQRALGAESLARAPPILLVNSFHDPESSIMWAVGLRMQMPTAVNIFRNGSGHTSYDEYGATHRAMEAFLIDGDVPEDVTVYQS